MIRYLSAVGLVCLAFHTQLRAETYRDAASRFSLELPDDWVVMDEAELKAANDRLKEQKMPCRFAAGFHLKDQPRPYIGVEVLPGKVASLDDAEAEAGKRLAAMQAQAGAAVEGFIVDRGRNRFTASVVLEDGGVRLRGLVIGHVGLAAVVVLHCHTLEAEFATDKPAFEKIADSFKFDSGFTLPAPSLDIPGAAPPPADAGLPTPLPPPPPPPASSDAIAHSAPALQYFFALVVGLVAILLIIYPSRKLRAADE